MKALRVNLSDIEIKELQAFRRTDNSSDSERALIILKSNAGYTAPQIAELLELHAHTVRRWIKGYLKDGIQGIKRKYAKGKDRSLRESVKEYLSEVIEQSPEKFGYSVSLWTTYLLKDWLIKTKQVQASQDTIERALKEMGYSYKRSKKTVAKKAPSKEEKQKQMTILLNKMSEKIQSGNCEIFSLDESHFSNEPYVVSGWQKKLWDKANPNTKQTREQYNIWMLEFPDKKVLLEEFKYG